MNGKGKIEKVTLPRIVENECMRHKENEKGREGSREGLSGGEMEDT